MGAEEAIRNSRIWDRSWSGLEAVFYFGATDYGAGTVNHRLWDRTSSGSTVAAALVERCRAYNRSAFGPCGCGRGVTRMMGGPAAALSAGPCLADGPPREFRESLRRRRSDASPTVPVPLYRFAPICSSRRRH